MRSKPFPAVVRSTLHLFCLFFPINFLTLILHEGGHALDTLAQGASIKFLYAHPFSFAGFSRPMPTWNSVWLRSGTVDLTWKDLRLPGILCAVSVGVGLIIIT
jgi:hypothetical protein